MSGDRPAANRMTLQTFKGRLGGAKKGHSLLKKKRDALKARFQMILMDIVNAKLESGQSLKDGAFALAKAHWANTGSDISATVVERVNKPSVTCKLSEANIAGVSIPQFAMVHDPAKDTPNQTLGVGHGGAVINATRQEYQKAVFALVKLASLQTMFYTLDLEIKMTSRRVNALEYVLIPRIVSVIAYITQEMDEQSREEFFRVKKVVEKKKQRLTAEKLRAAQQALMDAESDGEETSDEDEHAEHMAQKASMRLKMPHKRGSIMTTDISAAAALSAQVQSGHRKSSGDDDVVFK